MAQPEEMKRQGKKKLFLVSYTHWDREWYSTFQEFRIRLVKLFDKLLNILDSDTEYRHFAFDGQTVVLEDYLEIRPENREKLRQYVADGRIQVGPWYVQTDEFLVSGESIIRNLMIGHKIAGEFGGVMKVGFQPDPFGHIAQLPQILRGFGIDSAMFMRGLGKEAEKLGLEFIWRAPDGSEVLAVHQMPVNESGNGYSNADGLGYANPWVRENFDIAFALSKARESIDVLGKYTRTDCLLFSNGNDESEPQAELPQIIQYLNERLQDAEIIHSTFKEYVEAVRKYSPSLETHEGELRKARYMPLLVNVLSTRMAVKQKNFEAQNAIEKYAEPLASLAYLTGKEYPAALFEQSWKYLLQTHPHDTICGSGTDKVHEEALQRADWSQQISGVLIRKSMEHLAGKPVGGASGEEPLAVFNTLPWRRVEEVAVKGEIYNLDVPACGYRVYGGDELRKRRVSRSSSEGLTLENKRVKVEARPNGTLVITDKTTGLSYGNLNYFEDAEDCGDEYNYTPAEVLKTISTLDYEPVIEKDGYALKISYNLLLPASVVDICKRRSDETVACPLTTTVTLEGDSPVVRIRTRFDNRARDHRLRVGFNPGIRAEYSLAEGQFQVVRRPLGSDPEDWVREYYTGEYPQQNFMIVEDGKKGMIVANKGLPEYQLNEDGRLFVTLVRCVEWINNLGWVDRKVRQEPSQRLGFVPGAQCQGVNEYEYAVVTFSGAWEDRLRDVYNYIVPVTTLEPAGLGPSEKSFFALEPGNLLISAIKKAQTGNGVIVRIFNPTGKPTKGTLKTFSLAEAFLVQLDETRIRRIPTTQEGVPLDVEPYQIVTVELAYPNVESRGYSCS